MDYELMNNNRVTLSGTVTETPKFSHEVVGEKFYETYISVKRLSEQTDLLPLTISDKLLADVPVKAGDGITVSGQLRSYNKMEDTHSKLILSVFVRELNRGINDVNPNMIELVGYVCKPPVYRTTPFNREICDVLIAVNRAYNKSDYLPCIAWGRNARYVKNISVGHKVVISGRIQSRNYQKQLESGDIVVKTAYEVSVSRVEQAEQVEEAQKTPVHV